MVPIWLPLIGGVSTSAAIHLGGRIWRPGTGRRRSCDAVQRSRPPSEPFQFGSMQTLNWHRDGEVCQPH